MLRRLITLILGFLLLPAAAADFAAEMSAYQRGDFEAAVAEWRPLAEQGDTKSQEMIGFMYLQGQGVPRGDLLAVQWYRRAAEQGYVDAKNNLGRAYMERRGVPANYPEARRLFSAAEG
jgi:TPR repeat protein